MDLVKHITNERAQDGTPFLLTKYMEAKGYPGRLPRQFGKCGNHQIWRFLYVLS